MSPTKRPSAVDSLRRATAPAPRVRSDDSIGRPEDIGRLVAKAKPVRITVDLSPADYEALNRWIGAATTPEHPRLSQAQAIRMMIRATDRDPVVTGVVIDLWHRGDSR